MNDHNTVEAFRYHRRMSKKSQEYEFLAIATRETEAFDPNPIFFCHPRSYQRVDSQGLPMIVCLDHQLYHLHRSTY